MPRRLISSLHRRFGPAKDPQAAQAQQQALAMVGRMARATREGTQALFQAYYGGKQVASQLLHPAIFHSRDKKQRPYIVVVGAGFAGLACAYELVKSKQFNVILIESNPRVGGRVWSVRQNDFDHTITSSDHEYKTVERGGELVGLNHFLWLHYADEFDLHLDYLDPPILDPETTPPEVLAGAALMYEYMKLIFIELDEEAAKLDIYDETKSSKPWLAPEAARLDGVSLEAYLDGVLEKYKNITLEEVKTKGFSLPVWDYNEFVRAMNATKSDFENNNGLPCSEQSLYFNLVTIGNGNRSLDPTLLASIYDNIAGLEQAEKARKLSFWEDAELFRCREGNMALAVKFYEHILQGGGHVLLNTSVTDIVMKANHVSIITKSNGVSQRLKVPDTKISKVVLAMAPSIWNKVNISPPLPTTCTPKMGYLVKYLFDVPPEVVVEFRKCDNTTHTQWGMAWEAAWNTVTDGADVKQEFTLAVFAGGSSAHKLSNPPNADKLGATAARRAWVFENLNKMRPEGMTYTFDPASVIRDVYMDWPKEVNVEAGYSCPTLNEVTTLGPVIHAPINDKIFLAGEYACRYKWCGFMEGALISGAGAAKEIMKSAQTEKDAKPTHLRPIPATLELFRHPPHRALASLSELSN